MVSIYVVYTFARRRSSKMPFSHLLVPFPVRTTLFGQLSAYDIAKLDVVLRHSKAAHGTALTLEEQAEYLNPINDLAWNVSEMQTLIGHGMKFVLVGNEVSAFRERLKNPMQYIASYGHKRKLRVYLTGYFAIAGKSPEVLERMINFSLNKKSVKCARDEEHAEVLKVLIGNGSVSSNAEFLISFGGAKSRYVKKGYWQKVKDIPDKTIDLRVYVPSFCDRLRATLHLPCRERISLSRCILRSHWVLSLCKDLILIYRHLYVLECANLTPVGVKLTTLDELVGVRFSIPFTTR